MTKTQIIYGLRACYNASAYDPEKAHFVADRLLLRLIDDVEVRTLFCGMKKWYS